MKYVRRLLTMICVVTMLMSLAGCASWRKTDNVFEQLYYEVRSVKRGNSSILLTGTDTAYADYDLGCFVNVQIPDLDMCLDFDKESLYLLFFNQVGVENWNQSYMVMYRYDLRDQTLYGEESMEYLVTYFLASYFNWCIHAGEENQYSVSNLGEYTFLLQENVFYNH